MALNQTVTLNTGTNIPIVGFGTWLAKPGEVGHSVEVALKTGYRHLDLARVYGNQEEVGQAIRKAGVPRSDIFITSKLWNSAHKPGLVEKDLDRTLEQLGPGVDYLDLYLMHFPVSFHEGKDIDDLFPPSSKDKNKVDTDDGTSVVETYREMIKLLKTNKVRNIGVSNCTIEIIQTLIKETGVVPVVNQIERHPRLSQPELVEWCFNNKIYIQAYSPLGNNELGQPKVIDHDEFKAYSSKLSKDPGQVAIAWGRSLPAAQTKSGKDIPIVVLVKSVTPKRIELNFQDFELTPEEYKTIDEELVPKLGGQMRYNVPNGYEPSWNVSIWGDEREKGAEYSVKVV